MQEFFDAAGDQNEEKADITPDEDSTATDMELCALQESFDAADDHERPNALAPDQPLASNPAAGPSMAIMCAYCAQTITSLQTVDRCEF